MRAALSLKAALDHVMMSRALLCLKAARATVAVPPPLVSDYLSDHPTVTNHMILASNQSVRNTALPIVGSGKHATAGICATVEF